ncbi:aminoglycoside phosphotransferase family protein [Fretibacter rubidus]|uniref:aminoglycoside phosphotransferase family protein n=1 Tax=Fretibacter rubidus TaxID=570162 RepID=UPI00352A147E
MSERERIIKAFIGGAGWGDALRAAVPGDASARRYERLTLGDRRAVLMDAPLSSDLPPEPDGATAEARAALGYVAQARLAGADPAAFLCIASELSQRGFSAPRILAADVDEGLILLEDLGADLFAPIVTGERTMERPLYTAAVDCLASIYRSSFPQDFAYGDTRWRVKDYDETALLAEMSLMTDWYAPDTGVVLSDTAMDEWTQLWSQAFTQISNHAPGLALRDFHAENIFWMPERAGTANVGLIDFQDALMTHPSYDLASLIEDIRRDVSANLTDDLIARFCGQAGLKYDDDFRAAYAVMGAQRSTKLLGFPVRADKAYGKPQYRALLPRVKRHLNNSLAHDVMGDIRDWYGRYVPEVLS